MFLNAFTVLISCVIDCRIVKRRKVTFSSVSFVVRQIDWNVR